MDWKLIIIVLVIVTVAILLLLVGEVIPFLRRTVVLVEDPEHSDGRNVWLYSYLHCCSKWACLLAMVGGGGGGV